MRAAKTVESFPSRPLHRAAVHPNRSAADEPPPNILVVEVNRRLAAQYGVPLRSPLPLNNKSDPLDEMVYLTVTQRTHAAGSNAAFERLKARFPDWGSVAAASIQEVIEAVEPSGLADLKAPRIKRIIEAVIEEFGHATLYPLIGFTDEDAFRFLTKKLRAGAKTANGVMMYSLGRDVFPADTHCLRILRRLGVIPLTQKHETASRRIHQVVPEGIRFDLHVNMVYHGRAVCTGQRPKCVSCVLENLCPKVGVSP